MSDRKGDFIQTHSGGRMWPLDPRVEEIDIEDMIAAKSKLCRYNGHCIGFYSVLEHEALMMQRARMDGLPRVTIQQMGIHDGAEYALADLVRPIKRNMPEYLPAEERLMRVITQAFGIPYPFPEIVKQYDERIGLAEREQIMAKPRGYEWTHNFDAAEPLDVKIQCLNPVAAAALWIHEWKLCGGPWPRSSL